MIQPGSEINGIRMIRECKVKGKMRKGERDDGDNDGFGGEWWEG